MDFTQCAAVRVAAVGMAAAGSGDGRRAVSPPGDSRNSVVFPALAGAAGAVRWRGPLALFSGLTVLCIGGNAVIRQILNMIK